MNYGVMICADPNITSVIIDATLWRVHVGCIRVQKGVSSHQFPDSLMVVHSDPHHFWFEASKARKIGSPPAVKTFGTQNLAQSTGQAEAVDKWPALPSKLHPFYTHFYGWHSMIEGAWTHVALLLLHIEWLMESGCIWTCMQSTFHKAIHAFYRPPVACYACWQMLQIPSILPIHYVLLSHDRRRKNSPDSPWQMRYHLSWKHEKHTLKITNLACLLRIAQDACTKARLNIL